MPAKKSKISKKTSTSKDLEKKSIKKRAVSSKVKKTEAAKTEPAKTLEEAEQTLKILKYYEGVGRRKRAVARVRLFTRGDKEFLINNKPHTQYFATTELQSVADGALRKMKAMDKFRVSVFVRGGGIRGQAEAVRHAISRALVKFNPDFRKRLRRSGYLSRDPREKERRKFGLKKARRAPQWSKR